MKDKCDLCEVEKGAVDSSSSAATFPPKLDASMSFLLMGYSVSKSLPRYLAGEEGVTVIGPIP